MHTCVLEMYSYVWCWSVRRTEKYSIFDTSNKEFIYVTAIHLVKLTSYCNALEIIWLSAHIFNIIKIFMNYFMQFPGHAYWQHASSSQHNCTTGKIKTYIIQFKMWHQFMHHEIWRVHLYINLQYCSKCLY
jgi:hypothetical protein